MGKKHSISKVMLVFAWLMLCVNSVFAAWDGSIATTAPRDTSIEGKSYYLIDSEAKLAWFRDFVNLNKNNSAAANAKLIADLDMDGRLWIPICAGTGGTKDGKSYCLYKGTFDGNGHIIKNLYINGDSLYRKDKNYAQNLGFVAVLGNGAIKNLILENVEIQASTSTGEVLSNTANDNHQISVGAFVGWMNESGSNNVEKCMASGVISTTGKGQGVGGIVGNAKKGKISNCLSLVEIRTSGSDAYVGGIIGITKDAVTVSSCVYAGPGLINIGIKNGGSVGGIAGNVYSGKLTVQDDFYEGEDNLQLYGAKCFGNFNDKGKCKSSPSVKDASSVDVEGNVGRVNISNQDSVACHLNGMNADKTCKTEPWAVGETNLSLFGYGTDGYMIVFYANGGKYADGSEARNKFFDAGMVINADDIVPPSDEERTFVGWALTRDATAPVENLGTVSKSDTVFAVWQEKLTVIFNVSPGVFPDENVDMKTKRVDEGGLVTVGGLGTLPTSYCADSAGTCSLRYFTGWAKDKNSGINDTIHLDTLTAKENLALYAVWTAITTYTVTYNANGHGKTRVDYVHVGENETLTQPQDPVAHDGYVFKGWFTTSSCEDGTDFNFSTPITKSITLYAKWIPESYKITYKSVGDDGSVKDFGGEGGPVNSDENPSEYNIESETINLMAPTPAKGKAFDGWYKDKTFSKKVTRLAKGSFGDRTFYAKWSTKTYRIAYLADNDSYGAVSDQIKVHGESIQLESDGHFRRPGYDEQLGWTTTQDGSKVYDFGEVYTADASLILYPAWSEPIVYTITYECAGCENDPSNPVSYTVNTAKELKSPSEIPQGYKFGGWFTDKNCTKKISKIEKGTTGNLTLYGKLNQIYNITYVGTDTPNNPKTYTVDNNTIQLKAPASREHYTFVGWFDKDSEDGQQVTEIAKGSSGDKTLYARWAAVEYKITYTTNDGTLPDGVENPQIYTIESEDITLPIPSKDGYDFVGWYGNDEFNGDAITGIAKGTTGDTTLFAKWNGPIEYTIIYNNVEGATNENPTTYTVESDTIQLVAAVKAGYDFAGWFDKDGEEVTAIAKGSTGDTTLYAKWTAEVYSITYNANEGTLPDDAANPQTYTVEHAVTLPVPTKNGYDFVGWYDTENNKIEKIVKGSTGDIELTAKWSEPIEYTINYNNVENATNGNPTTYTVESDTIQLVAAVKAGYDFAGWFDKDGEEVTAIAKGSTGNIELTAKWEDPIAYTITYELNGGTIAENANPTTYTVETAATSLVAPTKDDYDFEGWFTADNVKYEEIGGGIVGNLKLIAHWTATSYSITYVLNEGELPEGVEIPQTYTIESEDITLPTPTKSGYTFAGWYDQYGYSVGNKIINQSSGDITLYARWSEPIEYTIAYNNIEGATNENPVTYTVESETIQLANAVKNGYTFEGWFDKDGKQVTEIAKGTTGDTTLFAKWSDPVKYEITYELNGGELPEGVSNPAEYTVESVITLPIPTKNGYNFVGWYDKKDNKIEKIVNGSTGDVVLAAKWEIIVYTIFYVAGGEGVEGENTSEEKTYGTSIRLKGEGVFTREGYAQDGWALTEDGEMVYAMGAFYSDNANVVLYPHWVKGLVVEHYGAVTIYRYPDKKVSAVLDGDYRDKDIVDIEQDIEVNSVTLEREFLVNKDGENKLSTIVLPFSIAKSNIEGATFFEMSSVIPEDTENQKRGVYISPTNDDIILANKPYIIRTTKANLTFNQKVTLNTSESKNTMTDDNQWTLVGMYRYKKWLENDKELGYAYGYTAKSTNKLAAGQFDINEAGAYIVPFRAYLLNVPPKAIAPRPFLAKSASTTTSVNGLPQTASLDVFVIDGSVAQKSEIAEIGETGGKTSIITVKTSPARMKIREGWYDMKGRRLNGKPSAKGIYYYNGKKIRIQ